MTLPVVFWSVPCFDKRRENPLPVYNRLFVLDWTSLDTTQTSEVLSILQPDGNKSRSPSSLQASVISIQRSNKGADDRMLAYRKYFVARPENADDEDTAIQQSFTFVNLNREYFEDENGREISHYAMIQHVSGQNEPVILGDVDSVLRLSLCDPVNVNEWSEGRANTIAQFLDVVERICNSRWYRRPPVFTFEIESGGDSTKFPSAADSKLLEAVFPNDSETQSVLAYFRQLHAGDRLLTRTCEAFIRNCGDERRTFWMTERLESFREMVDSAPVPFTDTGTRREIIKMFMYGAGLLHATSNDGADNRLAELIRTQGKHRAVMIFNHCLWDILKIAITVYHVTKREFEHWIGSCGLAPPTRVDMPSLFEGFVAPETNVANNNPMDRSEGSAAS